jgi:hypothetical protein
VTPGRILAIGLLTALATAGAAAAAETPERELQMLGRCALATSVYRSLMPPRPAPVEFTAADKDLYARMQLVEPLLRARADALAGEVDAAKRDAITAELKGQFQAQLAPRDAPRKTPREALDLYAPLLEGCIVRGNLLSEN